MSFVPPHKLDGSRWRDMRVGLFGGSFNPAHAGHMHVARQALRALDLDCIWWLVSPGNPLKNEKNNAPYNKRLGACRDLVAGHPKMIVSDIELTLNTRFTADSLQKLHSYFPNTQFTWIGGTDLIESFNKWEKADFIAAHYQMAFFARPPAKNLTKPNLLLQNRNNITFYYNMAMIDISSSGIRARESVASKASKR